MASRAIWTSKSNFSMTSRAPALNPAMYAAQVPGDLAGVVEEAAEVERRGVEELLPGHVLQHRVDVLDLALQRLGPLQDGGLRGLQHAVEAADNGQGEDDLAVLGLLVVTPEEVGHGPDEGGVVLDSGLGHRGFTLFRSLVTNDTDRGFAQLTWRCAETGSG